MLDAGYPMLDSVVLDVLMVLLFIEYRESNIEYLLENDQ